MLFIRQKVLAFAAGIALAFAASAANAATVVQVQLWDKGADATMATDLVYGTLGLDMTNATMGIKVEPATARAGVVTFNVANASAEIIHEMIVINLDDPTKPLAYVAAENRVDEDNVGDKGEVSELDPGASGSLTVVLQPGKYLLICNVPGHYAAGMWIEFEVTK